MGRNEIITLTVLMSIFLAVMSVVSVSAEEGVSVEADASVNPGVIELGNTTRVRINLTGRGTTEMVFPVDVVLVMDCSGSMSRYGTIIEGPEDVTLSTSYSKVGEFTLNETGDVEVMLQVPIDIYYYYDGFYARLKKDGEWATSEEYGYSTVKWNLNPGTYEIYAKLYSPYTTPERILAVELPPVRMESAKSAACEFVDLLKDDDRAGVVKFHSKDWKYEQYCQLVQPLESNKHAVKNKIENTLHADGGTPMGEGLDRALDHLESHHAREEAVKAIILLTDGWWNMGCNPIDQAKRAAEDGFPIYTIGWGGVNETALELIADITGGESYFPATPEDLEEIYEGLAKELSNITAKNVTLRVELSDVVEYAGNASVEPGEVNGKILTWDLGEISMDQTKSISFEVRPAVSGEVKLNTDNSSITYEDVYGHLHEVQLPVLSVRVTEPPVAVATANPDETFTYSDIVFDASASYDPDNISHIVSYEWDFDGDGIGDASGETVTHSFTDGTEDYTVTLTVTDNYGASNSTSVEVRVKNRAPNASIIGPDVVGEGTTAEFIANASDMDGKVVSYNWSFGDGHYGVGETVTHEYTAPGIYNVTLTAADDDGATATATHELRVTKPVAVIGVSSEEVKTYESVTLDGNGSYGYPEGEIASYNWTISPAEFKILEGTLNSSSLKVWFTDGTNNGKPYSITLTVTDNYGASNSTSVEVRVKNRAPNASIIGPDVTSEGVTVEFSANASDMDGEIVGYEWDFGDGGTGTGEKIEHAYSVPGEMEEIKYTVNLTVIDDDGATATATHELRVKKNLPPVAIAKAKSNETGWQYEELEVRQYEPVMFSAVESYDPDGHIMNYSWDFGDGNDSTLAGPIHVYWKNGSYEVKLRVRDNKKAWSTDTLNITVISNEYNGSFAANVSFDVKDDSFIKVEDSSAYPKTTFIGKPVTITINTTGTPTVTYNVLVDDSKIGSGKPPGQEKFVWIPMSSGKHVIKVSAKVKGYNLEYDVDTANIWLKKVTYR